MGGVPYYWQLLEKGLSLSQNIDAIFFSPTAQLKDEFLYLYNSLFNNPEKHILLIKAFGKKKIGLSRDELVKICNVSNNGDLTKKLEDLENCGFIRRYNQFGKKTKNSLYQLIDNFTLFYFKFMENSPTDEHFWENQYDSPNINAWRGLAFERVCLEHIPQIKNKLGIFGVLTDVCSWYCAEDPDLGLSGSQIDLLIVRKDQVINLCEMKYSSKEYTITKAVDENIRNKAADLRIATHTNFAIQKTLITTYGLHRNSYSDNIQNVVLAEDLFE